jgi:peptide/nickel transport system permease protein
MTSVPASKPAPSAWRAWVPFATPEGRRGVGAVLAGAAVLYAGVVVARAAHWSDLSRSDATAVVAFGALLFAGAAASARIARGDMRRTRRRLGANRAALAGLAILAVMVSVAVLAPLVSGDPSQMGSPSRDRYQAPGGDHVLGTDRFGRDVWSRVAHGARVSFALSALSVTLAVAFGTWVGALAGIAPARTDDVIMRGVDGMLAFPRLLLLLTVVALAPPGLLTLGLAVAATGWMGVARIVRGEVRRMRSREFVEAAIATGVGRARLVARHLLPNAVGHVVVAATLNAGTVILLESSLSFLGLGVQPPTPSWGSMIFDGRDALATAWWVSAFPALAVTVSVLGLNLLGDGLRDALDARVSIPSR